MTDPRLIAQRLLGAIDWQTEVHGYCRCPGIASHTSRNGARDCQVHVDGAPTIYCLHASCGPIVAQVNLQLRREVGQREWAIRLQDGRVIRSGDVIRHNGTITPREVIAALPKAKLGIAPAKRPALFTLEPDMGTAKADSNYISTVGKTAKVPPITEDLSRFVLEKNKTQLWWAKMSPAERKRQCAKRRANALKRRKGE